MLLFLPVHYITHRVNPASPESPIYSVGPAELDFEFVKLGLQQWPGRSWFLYAGLVACVAWHAAEGMQIIWNTWLRGSLGGWKSSLKSRSITAIAVVVPVLSGLFAIWREPLMTLASSATRFEAAFQKSVLFRF
ncbi:hypothetical protein EW026_g7074 [Hermanssonia centrifuga]|uniref:Mitochondrial adapter protein MCP1 transmembrane domain-containing protein n=1 Tax=Hermanssonia centrifuga TaxID=98765 RepID=A0A4S4KA09_9APHY|nr:hypothetical protein EW026_g7074 [Hermanssonia centrifuga]